MSPLDSDRLEPPFADAGRWQLAWRPPPPLAAEGRILGCRATSGPDRAGDAAATPADTAAVAWLGQVHGTEVAQVSGPGFTPACDAAVTTEPRLTLIVRVADCVPIFLVAPGGIAVAHAGWRGTAGAIAQRAVERLCAASGDRPDRLAAYLGPAIGPCCFEVGAEVAERFEPGFRRSPPRGRGAPPIAGREHLDLWAANRAQLVDAGLPPQRIQSTSICTRCHQHLFHSYRGSGGAPGRIECGLTRLGAS